MYFLEHVKRACKESMQSVRCFYHTSEVRRKNEARRRHQKKGQRLKEGESTGGRKRGRKREKEGRKDGWKGKEEKE